MASTRSEGYVLGTPYALFPKNARGTTTAEAVRRKVSAFDTMLNPDEGIISVDQIQSLTDPAKPIAVNAPTIFNCNLTINNTNTSVFNTTTNLTTLDNTTAIQDRITAENTSIIVYSNASVAIEFRTYNSSFASFDSNGNFSFNPSSIGGSTFTVKSKLITDKFQLTSTNKDVTSMYLQADNSAGDVKWGYIEEVRNSNLRLRLISTNDNTQGFSFERLGRTGTSTIEQLSFLDGNGNLIIGRGQPDLNNLSSTLYASKIRFAAPNIQVGSVVAAANIYGDLTYLPRGTGVVAITDQITKDNTSVVAFSDKISFGINSTEIATFDISGNFGIGRANPTAGLDNAKTTILRDSVKLTNLHPDILPAEKRFLQCLDTEGTAIWTNISTIFNDANSGFVIGQIGENVPVTLFAEGIPLFRLQTYNTVQIGTGTDEPAILEVAGAIIATNYATRGDIRFTNIDGTVLALIKSDSSFNTDGNITTRKYFIGDGSQISNISSQNVYHENVDLSTIINSLSTDTSNIYNTFISTTEQFFTNVSTIYTSVQSLSTMISTVVLNRHISSIIGYREFSTGIDNYISDVRTVFIDNKNIIFSTIRSGITLRKLIVGSVLTETRETIDYPTNVDISGSIFVGPNSKLFMSSGCGIYIGKRIFEPSYATIDVSGAICADSFCGNDSLNFLVNSTSVATFNSNGVLEVGKIISTVAFTHYSIDVSGNLNIRGDIIKNGQLYVNTIADLTWASNANNIYRASGKVGILTNNPLYELDVFGTIRCDRIIVNNLDQNGASFASTVKVYDSVWSTNGARVYYPWGPVGIGSCNSNPQYTLDVSGAVFLRNDNLYVSSGKVGIGHNAGAPLQYALDVIGSMHADNIVGGIRSPLKFFNSSTEVARFGTDGRLMIGTQNPTGVPAAVDLSGNINVNGKYFRNGVEITFRDVWQKFGTSAVYLEGNVGIGTINPQYALDVAGTIRCKALQIVKDISRGSAGAAGEIVDTAVFYWNSTSKSAYFISEGNVGIGTSTPTAKLQVAGSFAASTINTTTISTIELYAQTIIGDAVNGTNISIKQNDKITPVIKILSSGLLTLGSGLGRIGSVNGPVPTANITLAEGADYRGTFVDLRADSFNQREYYFTNTTTTEFVAPTYAKTIDIYAWGGGGGGMINSPTAVQTGGGAAAVYGRISVNAGDRFRITVGGGGINGINSGSLPGRSSGGGGGRSTQLEKWQAGSWVTLFILGGGGGAGSEASGGAAVASGTAWQGGNELRSTQNDPIIGIAGDPNGGGGSALQGGQGGELATGRTASSGTLGYGGSGDAEGGYGYYGGGGGVYPGAGGGGSSYVLGSAFTEIGIYDASGSQPGNVGSELRRGAGAGGSLGATNGAAGIMVFQLVFESRQANLLTIREGLVSTTKTYVTIARDGSVGINAAIENGTMLTVGGNIRASSINVGSIRLNATNTNLQYVVGSQPYTLTTTNDIARKSEYLYRSTSYSLVVSNGIQRNIFSNTFTQLDVGLYEYKFAGQGIVRNSVTNYNIQHSVKNNLGLEFLNILNEQESASYKRENGIFYISTTQDVTILTTLTNPSLTTGTVTIPIAVLSISKLPNLT